MSTIQFSPFTSIFENKASGTIIIGSPGSGKTFALNNIIVNELALKRRVFVLDPKNDMHVIHDAYPDLIDYIDVNNIKPGALDPFEVLDDIDAVTILSIVDIACGGISDDQETAITPAIEDFVIRFKRSINKVSFSDLAQYLYSHDNKDCRSIGTKLNVNRNSKYGKLLFNDDSEENPEYFKMSGRSIIISLHGMDLPKANMKTTKEQEFNSAIVYIICKMIRSMLSNSKKYPSLFVIDEAHIAYQTQAFANLIDEYLVLGRSLNCALIMASQSTHHYPQGIQQFISTAFCFKSSRDDALEFLNRFLPTDSDDSNTDFSSISGRINQFKGSGNAFMIDSNQRSGFIFITSNLGMDKSSNPLMRN